MIQWHTTKRLGSRLISFWINAVNFFWHATHYEYSVCGNATQLLKWQLFMKNLIESAPLVVLCMACKDSNSSVVSKSAVIPCIKMASCAVFVMSVVSSHAREKYSVACSFFQCFFNAPCHISNSVCNSSSRHTDVLKQFHFVGSKQLHGGHKALLHKLSLYMRSQLFSY